MKMHMGGWGRRPEALLTFKMGGRGEVSRATLQVGEALMNGWMNLK